MVAVKSIGMLSLELLKQLTTLKKFVMCDDAKDIQGVDELWPPLNTLDPVRSIPKFINSPQMYRLPQ